MLFEKDNLYIVKFEKFPEICESIRSGDVWIIDNNGDFSIKYKSDGEDD